MTRARCLLVSLVIAGSAVGLAASAVSGCEQGSGDDGPVIPGPGSMPNINGPNPGSGSAPPGADGGSGPPTPDAAVFDAGFPDTNQFPDAAIPVDGM